jgi:hypothetical protein
MLGWYGEDNCGTPACSEESEGKALRAGLLGDGTVAWDGAAGRLAAVGA